MQPVPLPLSLSNPPRRAKIARRACNLPRKPKIAKRACNPPRTPRTPKIAKRARRKWMKMTFYRLNCNNPWEGV